MEKSETVSRILEREKLQQLVAELEEEAIVRKFRTVQTEQNITFPF